MSLIFKDFGKNEHKMYLLAGDKGISRTLRKPLGYRNREIEFMTLIRREVKEGQIAFDVGANLGFVTLTLCKIVGPTGHVYAVEPVERNWEVLLKNMKLNGYLKRTTVERLGISDKDGTSGFFVSAKSNLGSINKKNKKEKKIEINVRSLDSYLSQTEELPDFYKMDVEGHEVEILNGMYNVAQRSKVGTKIIIEVHPKVYKGNRMETALRGMLSRGFRFKYVISAAMAQPDLFKEKGYSPIEKYESSGWWRGIYNNVSDEDAIYFCSYKHEQYVPARKRSSPKIVRAIMLEKIS